MPMLLIGTQKNILTQTIAKMVIRLFQSYITIRHKCYEYRGGMGLQVNLQVYILQITIRHGFYLTTLMGCQVTPVSRCA